MNHDDDIKSRLEEHASGGDDRPELPLQPVPPDRPFESMAGAQSDARRALLVGERADGQRHAVCPSSSSIHGAERLGEL